MPLIRPSPWLSILAAASALAACTNISYDRDDSIRVPAGATVAFAGGSSEGGENLDPAVGNDIVHRRIQTGLVTQLEAKGFKVVNDQQSADFLVRYFVGVQRRTQQVATTSGLTRNPSWGPGWGWGWGGSTVTTVTPVDFADASFVVDLVERSTGRTAWRGIWRGDPGPRAPTQQEIDNTLARMFRSAPAPG